MMSSTNFLPLAAFLAVQAVTIVRWAATITARLAQTGKALVALDGGGGPVKITCW